MNTLLPGAGSGSAAPDTDTPNPVTRTQVLEFQGCPAGTELHLVAVQGGGHNWPGHPGVLPPQVAGNVSTDFDASELIYRFFQRHALE